jgi:Transposase DDE domain group 1
MVELLKPDRIAEVSLMSHDAIPTFRFGMPAAIGLEATFDGGALTSDGGLPWLVEADRDLGLCAAFASCLKDWRKDPTRIRHTLENLVRQRVFQMACGYEDQDDADTLRDDPIFKLACGQLPLSGAALASQPTLSRLENCVDRHACRRLADALVEIYLTQRGKAGPPSGILLDCDSTDDPTHGAQEGSAYHGYYRQHMYHPLLIFDGETGHLITAILRPGTAHASRFIVGILRQLLRRLRARWPTVRVELRADSGFARPRLYRWCEREQIAYTIGLAGNARLAPLAQDLLAQAIAQQKATGVEKVRLAGEATYRARSWDTERRVVYKAEALVQGPNVRFVVTTSSDAPLAVYDHYVERGEPEQWIDQLKATCFADRLSCCDFWPNQFRLFLAAATYWLLDTLRSWLPRGQIPPMRLQTLRLVALKIGARVFELASHVRLRLASSHPGQALWPVFDRYRNRRE